MHSHKNGADEDNPEMTQSSYSEALSKKFYNQKESNDSDDTPNPDD